MKTQKYSSLGAAGTQRVSFRTCAPAAPKEEYFKRKRNIHFYAYIFNLFRIKLVTNLYIVNFQNRNKMLMNLTDFSIKHT